MAGVIRLSMLKSVYSSVKPISKLQPFNPFTNSTRCTNQSLIRSLYAFVNQDCSKEESKLAQNFANAHPKIPSYDTSVVSHCFKANSIFLGTSSPNSLFGRTVPYISASSMLSYRSFSSSDGKINKPGSVEVSAASSGSNDVGNGGDVGIDWIEKVRDSWQSAVDAVTYTVQKTKEVYDEMVPYSQQLLDSHPYLKEVIVPVGYTSVGTMLAWVVMPRLLRMFHKYAMQTPASLLSKSLSREPVPYEKSFWGALEDPVRYLVTFMAFLKIGMMVAPTTIASQYMAQGWRGAIVLSFVWFLYRWKTNVFSRALGAQSLSLVDKERMLTLDKVSSIGLFVIGLMALAEACGVAVQSILTVGGIGGVATAFAAKDILGNVLSGLSMQFSKPFSLGDTIKAGSIEGQVVEMGLTTTMLLNVEKFPVLVPNSLFSSQVIVNKSRAQWRSMTTKLPVKIDDLEKIPQISNEIASMLKSNPKVFLEKEAPYCFLSRVESSFAELTIGCNLRHMSKNELYSAEQDILLQSVRILKEHGARLGSTWQDVTTQ